MPGSATSPRLRRCRRARTAAAEAAEGGRQGVAAVAAGQGAVLRRGDRAAGDRLGSGRHGPGAVPDRHQSGPGTGTIGPRCLGRRVVAADAGDESRAVGRVRGSDAGVRRGGLRYRRRDRGGGGGTAGAGRRGVQVLVVTHSPQVAARGARICASPRRPCATGPRPPSTNWHRTRGGRKSRGCWPARSFRMPRERRRMTCCEGSGRRRGCWYERGSDP